MFFLRSKSQSSFLAKQLLPFLSRARPRSQPMAGHSCLNLFGNLLIIQTLLLHTCTPPLWLTRLPSTFPALSLPVCSAPQPSNCSLHTPIVLDPHGLPHLLSSSKLSLDLPSWWELSLFQSKRKQAHDAWARTGAWSQLPHPTDVVCQETSLHGGTGKQALTLQSRCCRVTES